MQMLFKISGSHINNELVPWVMHTFHVYNTPAPQVENMMILRNLSSQQIEQAVRLGTWTCWVDFDFISAVFYFNLESNVAFHQTNMYDLKKKLAYQNLFLSWPSCCISLKNIDEATQACKMNSTSMSKCSIFYFPTNSHLHYWEGKFRNSETNPECFWLNCEQ